MAIVGKQKLDDLASRMEKLGIREEELVEKFVLGSGRGGQKMNKTASTVYLKHTPTGIEVKCGKDRSRELNRFLARRQLCERFEQQELGIKPPRELQADKLRKQKKRRKRRQTPENA